MDYCGNFIYADNQLIIIFAGDVRIAPVNFGNSTYWKYEYSMKDHLGNTRVVFAAHSYGQPELLQQTSYYPFGMTMQQQNFYSQNATENKYLYNSKELQDDQLAGNTCYLPNKGTEFSHLSWPRGVYGDVPGDREEFMGGGSHTPFLEYRKKTKKIVEEKVEQGDFNNFDLFDFYVSSFETPGMSFNVQIHPDIDGEETKEGKEIAGGGGFDDIPLNPAVGMGERIVGIANGYVGSIDYNLLSKKGDFLPGNTKCNKFVYDVLLQAGASPGLPNQPDIWGMPGPKPPIAAQWANANYNIPGWVVVSSPTPGDVASFSGHVGITFGNGLTISATLHNGVVRNDWGFRIGQTPVFRRFVGYSQYY